MDIGKEKKKINVEPVKDPVPGASRERPTAEARAQAEAREGASMTDTFLNHFDPDAAIPAVLAEFFPDLDPQVTLERSGMTSSRCPNAGSGAPSARPRTRPTRRGSRVALAA
jgi:hypothetical protein